MQEHKIKPTESELEILQILWEKGPSSVRYVNDLLNKKRSIGYTTTLKIMQIMTEKKLVKRNTESRSHIYDALSLEQETKKNLLQTFINNTFKGSTASLVMQALGSEKTSKEDLEEIKSLIEKLENK
jgi:predicted transcriptional regulator